jgi:hypothetical protein
MGLAARGHSVSVCAPSWRGEELPPRAGLSLCDARLEITPRHLPSSPEVWPLILGALHRTARAVSQSAPPDLWLANWWPTGIAAPQGAPCVAVLHGSDVDLAERLPRGLAHGLATRLDGAIAVAPHLAQRFHEVTRTSTLGVVPLGASRSVDDPVPPAFASWAVDGRARVLTVGRDALGKGLSVARDAARTLDDVAWAFVTPEDSVGPSGIRALLRDTDLLVVPSRGGEGVPTEGRPHVLTQALVAGVPIVGGPNPAVRTAVREAGQVEVGEEGAQALVTAVQRALGATHAALRQRAQRVGRDYAWSAVLPQWESVLASGLSARSSRRTTLNASL